MTQEFGGRIGRDWRDSKPWWPAERVAPRRRAQRGARRPRRRRVRPARLLRLGHRDAGDRRPRRGRACGSPTSTRPRCARRRARACSPGATTTAAGWAASPTSPWASPATGARRRARTASSSEVLRDAGYATYAVGKWHLTPEDETHMAASRATVAAGAGLRPLVRVPRRRDAPVRPGALPRQSLGAPAALGGRRLPPQRGPGRPGDRVPGRPARGRRAIGPSSSTSRPGRATPRTSRRRAGANATPAASTTAGTHWREATFARQLASGVVPPGTSLSPRPPWVRAWSDLGDDERRVAARFMECFAGFLSHTDEQVGRVLDFVARPRGARRHARRSRLGQRGQRRGRVRRLDQRRSPEQPGPRGHAPRCSSASTRSAGPLTHNNYPWGWTMAGNTPFRRWKREVHEGGVADPCIVHWPARSRSRRARRATSSPTRSTCCPRFSSWSASSAPERVDGRRAVPHRRRELRLPPRRDGADAPERHDTQYFEMFGSRAIYHRGLEGRAFHPIGPLYDDQRPERAFDEDVWELYDVRADLSETRDLAREQPERLAAMVDAVVGRGRAQPGAAPGQPGAVGPRAPQARSARAARRPTATSPAGPRSPSRSRSTCATARTASSSS